MKKSTSDDYVEILQPSSVKKQRNQQDLTSSGDCLPIVFFANLIAAYCLYRNKLSMQSFVESVLGSPDSKALTAYFQPVACSDAPHSQSRQLSPWKFANDDRFDAGIIMSGMICDHGPGFGIVAHTASVCSFGTEALVFKTFKILAGGVQSYARMSTVSCTVSVYPLFIVSLVPRFCSVCQPARHFFLEG